MRIAASIVVLAAAVFLAGCKTAEHAHKWQRVDKAVALVIPTANSSAHGVVTFTESADGVRVVADIRGLRPNSKHGFHIHEYGDLRAADGTSAGDHYNPEGHDHALPHASPRHAGDLGNLVANADGNARMDITVENMTIAGLKNPVIGRAVVVHADPDTGIQPSGGAGARIGVGTIGIANPSRP